MMRLKSGSRLGHDPSPLRRAETRASRYQRGCPGPLLARPACAGAVLRVRGHVPGRQDVDPIHRLDGVVQAGLGTGQRDGAVRSRLHPPFVRAQPQDAGLDALVDGIGLFRQIDAGG